jgi:hypothetical protein
LTKKPFAVMRIPEKPKSLKEDTSSKQKNDGSQEQDETIEESSESSTSNESTSLNVASKFITAVAQLTVQTVTSQQQEVNYDEIGSAYTPQIDDDSYVYYAIHIKPNELSFI